MESQSSALRAYGPSLPTHTVLRRRQNSLLQDFFGCERAFRLSGVSTLSLECKWWMVCCVCRRCEPFRLLAEGLTTRAWDSLVNAKTKLGQEEERTIIRKNRTWLEIKEGQEVKRMRDKKWKDCRIRDKSVRKFFVFFSGENGSAVVRRWLLSCFRKGTGRGTDHVRSCLDGCTERYFLCCRGRTDKRWSRAVLTKCYESWTYIQENGWRKFKWEVRGLHAFSLRHLDSWSVSLFGLHA